MVTLRASLRHAETPAIVPRPAFHPRLPLRAMGALADSLIISSSLTLLSRGMRGGYENVKDTVIDATLKPVGQFDDVQISICIVRRRDQSIWKHVVSAH